MSISLVGVDIAKFVFHVHGVDRHDQVEWRGKYKRDKWLDAIIKRVPVVAEIRMKACSSSQHWARALQARGYRVKLVAALFVKPYVKSNKNDSADAKVICDAMARPDMRFVTIKTVAQQDEQAAHRIRSAPPRPTRYAAWTASTAWWRLPVLASCVSPCRAG